MTNQEIFNEIRDKVLGKKKGDFFIISQNYLGASVYENRKAHIKNAVIIVNINGCQKEWFVEHYKLKVCPDPFIMCVRHIDSAALCIGLEDDESSYHFFKHMQDKEPESYSVIGVIETDDETVGFSYDWEMKRSNYLYLEKESDEDSGFFSLMYKMRNVEVMNNGTHEEKSNRF